MKFDRVNSLGSHGLNPHLFTYFNYKKTFSIVLLAICNANYEFVFVDIGAAGKIGDGIETNKFDFPNPSPLPNYQPDMLFPYTFVADEAFAMKPHMMRPYPRKNEVDKSQTVFNYRLSRARRVIENSFGILASRFRIFRRPIIAKAENVISIVKATVALHNLLMKSKSQQENFLYCPDDFVDQEGINGAQIPGRWRNQSAAPQRLIPINSQGSNNFTRNAKLVRNNFKEYFSSMEGAVEWQDQIINSTSNAFDEEY